MGCKAVAAWEECAAGRARVAMAAATVGEGSVVAAMANWAAAKTVETTVEVVAWTAGGARLAQGRVWSPIL